MSTAELPAGDDIGRDATPATGDPASAPWIGYDDQAAATIVSFVRKSSPTQAREVRDYERAHAARPVVIAEADRRLVKWHA